MLALMHFVVWWERPNGASEPGLFSDGNCRGGLCGARVGVNAGGNARTIRPGGALEACAGLGDHRVAGRVRAALSAGWAAVARVGRRRGSDVIADPQFRLLCDNGGACFTVCLPEVKEDKSKTVCPVHGGPAELKEITGKAPTVL